MLKCVTVVAGHGDQGWKYIPKPVLALAGVVIRHVACGSYHTAAISVDGELYTWGGGMYGKLGHGNETGQPKPLLVQSLRGMPIAQVSCGSRHTLALLETGVVYSWGDRDNGVCGHGDVDGAFLPVQQSSMSSCCARRCALVVKLVAHPTEASTHTGYLFAQAINLPLE